MKSFFMIKSSRKNYIKRILQIAQIERKLPLLHAYLRRQEHKDGCVGSFGVAFGIQQLHRSSLCRKCYDSKGT